MRGNVANMKHTYSDTQRPIAEIQLRADRLRDELRSPAPLRYRPLDNRPLFWRVAHGQALWPYHLAVVAVALVVWLI